VSIKETDEHCQKFEFLALFFCALKRSRRLGKIADKRGVTIRALVSEKAQRRRGSGSPPP
jgi:hypothetical protein